MMLPQVINPVLPDIIGSGGMAAGGTAIGNILSAIIGAFILVGAIAAFIFLLIGGLNWITSTGDKAKLEHARETITQAIIGLIILAAVWAVMTLVTTFLGVGEFGGGSGIFTLPTIENITGNSGGGNQNQAPNANQSCTTLGLKPSENGGRNCCSGLTPEAGTGTCKKPNSSTCSGNSECLSGNCAAEVGALKVCQPAAAQPPTSAVQCRARGGDCSNPVDGCSVGNPNGTCGAGTVCCL